MQIKFEQMNPKGIKPDDYILVDGSLARVTCSYPSSVVGHRYIRYKLHHSGGEIGRAFSYSDLITKLVIEPPAQEPKNTKTYSLAAGLGHVEIDTKTLDSLEVGMYASWFDGQRQVTLTIERADFVTPRSRSAEDEIRLAAAVVADSYNLTIEEMEVLQIVLVNGSDALKPEAKWHYRGILRKTGKNTPHELIGLAHRKLEDYDCEVIRV